MRAKSWKDQAAAGLLMSLVVAVTLLVAAPAQAEPAESREAYVAKLDPICLKDYKRTTPLLKGIQKRILKGKYADAARRVARATRIFESTLRRTRRIEPAVADKATVDRWFKQLDVQVRLMRQMVKVIKSKNRKKIYSQQAKIMRNRSKANNIVFLFDFKHCLLPAGI